MKNNRLWFDETPEAEAQILKIALCRKYQQDYSDIDTLCRRAGLYPAEAEAIKRWKQHSIGDCSNEINRLLSYIEYEEPERYRKALYIYNTNR